MEYLAFMILGYFSGSVMYACTIPKLVCGKDVRESSRDKNPGTANVFMFAGAGLGIFVLCCELLKGFVPVYLAAQRLDTASLSFAFIMAAPVAGHAFSVFLKGKGGKAIAVSFGVLLGLFPILPPVLALAFFYLLFSLVFVILPHLYRSAVTFACFSLAVAVFSHRDPVQMPESIALGCLLISGIVIYKHIYAGEKSKFTLRFFGGRKEPEQLKEVAGALGGSKK